MYVCANCILDNVCCLWYDGHDEMGVYTMGRTSATVKNRYAAKAYDRIVTLVPKGQKQAIEAFARGRSESVNGLFNRLVRVEMGVSEDDWRATPNSVTLAAMEEADAITDDPNVPGYTDFDELMAALKS